MIAEQLAGKRIAITGGTGFVGTALIERLLRSVPDCTLVLLVRAGKRTSVEERVRREILKNNDFDRLRGMYAQASPGRTSAGGSSRSAAETSPDQTFDQMCAERIHVIAG